MKIDKFYLDDGTYIRFKKIGKGAPILLLHTFRNRLEYSDKLGKLLEDKFTVYSIDLPGFGDSPINTNTNYNLNFFTKSIVYFIKKLKIKNLTIAGESIGATLAASVSVELPKVVKKIFMFNTYDYDSFLVKVFKEETFLLNLFCFM
ncbi:MAG: alpha/beta fold hydrolase [Alphaproteobacteria bacterium]